MVLEVAMVETGDFGTTREDLVEELKELALHASTT
jgi:hypothetical protein